MFRLLLFLLSAFLLHACGEVSAGVTPQPAPVGPPHTIAAQGLTPRELPDRDGTLVDRHTREDDVYVRHLKGVTSSELAALLDLDVPKDALYYGQISYLRNRSGQYEPHGGFTASASEKVAGAPDYTGPILYQLAGSFERGRKEGLFELREQFYETETLITVEYARGGCAWFTVEVTAEGQTSKVREEQPESCSLAYMRERVAQGIH